MIWIAEKIAALSPVDVKSLLVNVSTKGNLEIAAFCESELLARKPTPKAAFALPEGFVTLLPQTFSQRALQ